MERQGKHIVQNLKDAQIFSVDLMKRLLHVLWCLISIINSALSQLKFQQVDHFQSRSNFTTAKLISEHVKC